MVVCVVVHVCGHLYAVCVCVCCDPVGLDS